MWGFWTIWWWDDGAVVVIFEEIFSDDKGDETSTSCWRSYTCLIVLWLHEQAKTRYKYAFLIHFSHYSVVVLIARLLVQRWKKAEGLKSVAFRSFVQLTTAIQGKQSIYRFILVCITFDCVEPITNDHVEQWIQDEKTIICSSEKRIG